MRSGSVNSFHPYCLISILTSRARKKKKKKKKKKIELLFFSALLAYQDKEQEARTAGGEEV